MAASTGRSSHHRGNQTSRLAVLLLLCCWASAVQGWDYDHNGLDWPGDCLNGKSQSPINIVTANAKSISGAMTFKLNYSSSMPRITLVNSGHSIQLKPPAGYTNTLTLADGVYDLLQAHGHATSEHAINGLLAPFELHFVHQSRTNSSNLAVVGVLYPFSSTDSNNTFINLWIKKAPRAVNETKTVAGKFNLLAGIKGAAPSSKVASTVYTYRGSLTTPGCGQVVQWFVMDITSSPTISQAQVIDFMNIQSDDNHGDRTDNRPIQPLNGRKVSKFTGIY